MSGTAIGVLLRASLDKADYKVLVGMTREPVLDVMCVNDLGFIRTPEAINANPLRGCSHRKQFFDEVITNSRTQYFTPFLLDDRQLGSSARFVG
jgi:hypothetical protein